MKKIAILCLSVGLLMLSACSNYHAKQEVDSTYYKKTQSVAWPESQTPAKPTVRNHSQNNG